MGWVVDRLFCRTLVGRLFVFHVLALHKPVISFGFHCVDSARAWRLPEGLGAGEALAPTQRNRDTALLVHAPPQEGGGSRSGEKAASRYSLTTILRTFSLLGRTKSLTCELWRSSHHPHPRLREAQVGPLGQIAANTTSCPSACK